MREGSKVLLQIRLLCRILLRRLKSDEELEVQTLCSEYFSPEFDDPFYISSFPQQTETTFTVFYSILIILALTSNLLALWLMFKRKSKSYHNSMVVSLTISSLMLLAFCVPLNMSLVSNPFWDRDNVHCKVVTYLQNVAVVSAMLAPVFIATDRYQAILRPLQFRTKTNSGSNFFALIFLWSLAFVVSMPNVYWFREIEVHNIQTHEPLRSRILNLGFNRPSRKTVATTVSTDNPQHIFSRSTSKKSTTTTEYWQADEQLISRNICVHSLDHIGPVLIYRSIITVLFFISFTIMLSTYSTISYRLFRRSHNVENQSSNSFHCHSNVNPHLDICYHIPNQTPSKNPFTLTVMPHFVYYKNRQVSQKLSSLSIRADSSDNIATEYPKDVHRFYIENGALKNEYNNNEMAHAMLHPTESTEISQKYLIAWRSSALFGAVSLTYFASWCPIIIFELYLSASHRSQMDDDSLSRNRFVFQYLACINSCLNPFLYIILQDFHKLQLKEYLEEMIKNCWCVKKIKSNKVEPGEQVDENSFSLPIQEPTHSQQVGNLPLEENVPQPNSQWMMHKRQKHID